MNMFSPQQPVMVPWGNRMIRAEVLAKPPRQWRKETVDAVIGDGRTVFVRYLESGWSGAYGAYKPEEVQC